MSDINLLRLRISKDARVPRVDFTRGVTTDDEGAWTLPPERNTRDAVRCAVTYLLRQFQRFDRAGMTCKALAAAPQGSRNTKVMLEIHVQERRHKEVTYSATVVKVLENGRVQNGPGAKEYPEIGMVLSNSDLPTFGRMHLFEPDIRRLLDGQLAEWTVRLWPGTFACLSSAGLRAVEGAIGAFARIPNGEVRLSALALDNTEANREAIADELTTEHFVPTYDTLTERAEKPGANAERLYDELAEILARQEAVETLLGQDMPACIAAAEAAEAAILALFEANER